VFGNYAWGLLFIIYGFKGMLFFMVKPLELKSKSSPEFGGRLELE